MRQLAGEHGRELVREPWQVEPRGGGDVAGDRAVPAAVANDRDPRAPQRARAHERLHKVDHLMRRLHEVHARRARSGRDHGRARDQRPGVRPRGARARLGRADGEQHDGLFGGGGRVHEGAPVAEVLGVDGDHLGRLVLGERGDELRKVDVGLVPDRGEPREAELDRAREDAELEGEVAALRDQADRALRELVRGDAEVGARVEDAEAVRPEQHRTGIAHPRDQRPLARLRLGAQLAEPGRDADQRPRAGGQGVVDGLLEGGRRDRDDHELGHPGKLAERPVRRPSEHAAAVSVHQVDPGGGARPEAHRDRASCPTWRGRQRRRRSRRSSGRRGGAGRGP